jgi:hypothetical protein
LIFPWPFRARSSFSLSLRSAFSVSKTAPADCQPPTLSLPGQKILATEFTEATENSLGTVP